MVCKKCGSEFDGKFCSNCGMTVDTPEQNSVDTNLSVTEIAPKKKQLNPIAIIIPVVAVVVAVAILVCTLVIKNSKSDSKNDNNNNSEESSLSENKPNKKYKSANVGDIITFGSYEQDNDTSNGKEEIEWRVLAREDDRALVVSEYALDCKPYHTEWEEVTWETCTLRKWLNNGFLNEAFSAEEQTQIQSTKTASDEKDAGNDITDKVFLLSMTEVEEYFSSDEDQKCIPTEYAIAQGTKTYDDYTKGDQATCSWWLRSAYFISDRASAIYFDGHAHSRYCLADATDLCVRPALWIEI